MVHGLLVREDTHVLTGTNARSLADTHTSQRTHARRQLRNFTRHFSPIYMHVFRKRDYPHSDSCVKHVRKHAPSCTHSSDTRIRNTRMQAGRHAR